MVALSSYQWTMVAVMGACYVAICFRTAFRMARSGRSLWKWLAITVFCTSIPAVVVLMREHVRSVRGTRPGAAGREPPAGRTVTCPHCGKPVRPRDLDVADGVTKCPHCGLVLDEATYG